MVDPIMVKRPCGHELKTKQWKQGSSISCLERGETIVSTPAPPQVWGMEARIEQFCEGCKLKKEAA